MQVFISEDMQGVCTVCEHNDTGDAVEDGFDSLEAARKYCAEEGHEIMLELLSKSADSGRSDP